jgi:hypothetical protein
MSDPRVAKPGQGNRSVEFGMFLLDKGVPMNIVYPAVKQMEVAYPPKRFYSGGSSELHSLRNKNKGK